MVSHSSVFGDVACAAAGQEMGGNYFVSCLGKTFPLLQRSSELVQSRRCRAGLVWVGREGLGEALGAIPARGVRGLSQQCPLLSSWFGGTAELFHVCKIQNYFIL